MSVDELFLACGFAPAQVRFCKRQGCGSNPVQLRFSERDTQEIHVIPVAVARTQIIAQRLPPLTEPERNAVKLMPTVTNSGTAELLHRRSPIVAFLSEPAKGKPPATVAAFASGSESKNSLLYGNEHSLSLFRTGAFLEANCCFPWSELLLSVERIAAFRRGD